MSFCIREEARYALQKHVVEPLVPRCIDHEYGGFLVDFDERWQPVGPHDKSLEHASRSTIAYAMLGNAELARIGCAYLQSAMWDAEHGGFYAQVDRAGHPHWDGMKHPHAVTYAAQAFVLAAPYLAPGEGREWASRAMSWLDDVAWDAEHGGYWGTYDRYNQRYPDGARLPTGNGRDPLAVSPGFKEANTLGDAIETLTTFVAHDMGARSAERLAWLVDLVVARLTDASGMLPYLYRRDWRPLPAVLQVGQQFQIIPRLLAASAYVNCGARERAEHLLDFLLATARHPSGGFCLSVTADGRTWPATSEHSDARQWWVQLEAVRAMHALSRTEARDAHWRFTRDHYFDHRHGGIWEAPYWPRPSWRERWFGPKPVLRKTHAWKDPLHEVGAFLALLRD